MEHQLPRMKAGALAFVLLLLPWAGARAQTGVKDLHLIASGHEYNVPTDAYLARTPYTLIWKAEKSSRSYVRNGRIEKITEIYVNVYDQDTGKVIARTDWQPLDGEMKIPVAGRHYLRVYAPAKWTVSFREDKAMLERAASRGELKEGMTVKEANGKSQRTKDERIEAVKERMLRFIEAHREELGVAGVDSTTADVHKAAQLATDEKDFTARYQALSRATMEKFGLDPETVIKVASTKGGRSKEAAEDLVPVKQDGKKDLEPEPETKDPGWSGEGLPPGMRVRSEEK